MIVCGAGASTCAAACEQRAASRLTEVAITTVPAGTSTNAAERAGRISSAQAAGCAPHSNEVPSVQMQCRMTAILRVWTGVESWL